MKSDNAQRIRLYVIGEYIRTGQHLFVSDIAKHFNTNALGVRNALGYDDFVFDNDSRWSGGNMTGKYILCACVEPTKTYLVQMIQSLTESIALLSDKVTQ